MSIPVHYSGGVKRTDGCTCFSLNTESVVFLFNLRMIIVALTQDICQGHRNPLVMKTQCRKKMDMSGFLLH